MSALTTNTPKLLNDLSLDNIRERLRNKLFISLAAMLTLALLVSIVSVISQIQQIAIINRVVSTDTRIGQANSEILETLSEIQQNEQNFFASYQEIGSGGAKATYLDPWEQSLLEVESKLEEVNTLLGTTLVEATSSSSMMAVSDVQAILATYKEQTLLATDLALELGTKSSGLEYEKLLASTIMEGKLFDPAYEPILLEFLRVRRAEKDFFITSDPVHIDTSVGHMMVIHEQIAALENTTDAKKLELDDALVDYHVAFDKVIAITTEQDEIIAQNGELMRQAEQLMESALRVSLSDAASAETEVFNLVTRSTFIIAILTAVALIAGIILARILTARLTTQTDELVSFFDAVDQEDVNARAQVISRDELGSVAQTLNQVLEERRELIQTSEQRQAVEASIRELIIDMERVSLGDLSSEASVSMEITAVVADSFNFMIEQMRQVIVRVQDATTQVSSSTNEIQTTAEYLAAGSEAQVDQIIDTSAAIDEMSVSIQKVSRNSVLSASIGSQARTTALRGSEATQQMVSSLEQVREQIDSTATLVDRLSDDAVELSDIVRLIDSITERTSVLALNASIQASAAGDAGRGFLAVASDVESLVTQSVEANREIKTLIRTIQQETNAASEAILNTRQEAQAGLHLAQEAGERLTEIESVTNHLAELIQSISQASQQQARGSESIARSMTEIATVSQETANGTRNATHSVRSLATIADDLRSFVDRFKLT